MRAAAPLTGLVLVAGGVALSAALAPAPAGAAPLLPPVGIDLVDDLTTTVPTLGDEAAPAPPDVGPEDAGSGGVAVLEVFDPVVPPALVRAVDVVEPVVDLVEPALTEVVEPVLDVVDPLVDAVVEPVLDVVEPVVDVVVEPIVDVVEPLVDVVVQPIVDVIVPVVGPAVDAVVPVPEAVVEPAIAPPVVAPVAGGPEAVVTAEPTISSAPDAAPPTAVPVPEPTPGSGTTSSPPPSPVAAPEVPLDRGPGSTDEADPAPSSPVGLTSSIAAPIPEPSTPGVVATQVPSPGTGAATGGASTLSASGTDDPVGDLYVVPAVGDSAGPVAASTATAAGPTRRGLLPDAARAVKTFTFPLVLALLVLAFLLVQGRLPARDPKLGSAPVRPRRRGVGLA